MPSNVTFEFEKARLHYEQANSPEAKLTALLEMQRTAPSHKGAENMRADISRKIAIIKREIEKRKQQEKKKSGKSISVPKEGIGQVVIVGMPNSGKSTLLKKLTGVEVLIASYEFSTTKPIVGMMDYHNAKVQLVEVPAIVKGSSQGKFNGTQLLAVIRNADAIILTPRNYNEENVLREELKNAGIITTREKPKIKIITENAKKITIAGKKQLKCSEKELVQYLKDIGLKNASVILSEPTDLELVSMALNESLVYKKTIAINTIAINNKNISALKEKIFQLLGKVLVYTKKPGEEIDYSEPMDLPEGTTVEKAAKHLHKDFSKMKYAKLWGSSKYAGQRVPRKYILKNFDVLEIYC